MTSVINEASFYGLLYIFAYSNYAFSAEMWRYSSKEGDGTLFSTQSLIILEHFGVNSSVDWCYPIECQIKSKSYSSVTLHCPKPGLHAVGPITNASDNQVFRVLLSIPQVSFITALNLCWSFNSLQEIIKSTPSDLEKRTPSLSSTRAEKVYCYLRHKLIPK